MVNGAPKRRNAFDWNDSPANRQTTGQPSFQRLAKQLGNPYTHNFSRVIGDRHSPGGIRLRSRRTTRGHGKPWTEMPRRSGVRFTDVLDHLHSESRESDGGDRPAIRTNPDNSNRLSWRWQRRIFVGPASLPTVEGHSSHQHRQARGLRSENTSGPRHRRKNALGQSLLSRGPRWRPDSAIHRTPARP